MLRIIVAKGDQFDPYLFTPTRIDTIAYGCLLAYFWRTAACRGMLDRMKRRCDLWLIVLVLTLVAASSIESSLYRLTLRFSVCGVIMAAIVALAVDNPECRIGTVLNWRPAVFVGVLSYSLYLWQPLATRPILLACAALGSYFVVERPFLRLKDAGRPLASRTVRM
jgi:peptidoglycan/LPS O-acetylase OafA/YrhL